VATVLVALPSGEGIVRFANGDIVVTPDVNGASGERVRQEAPYRPAKSWLGEEHFVVGGLLPPGAISAEAVDGRGVRLVATVGGGAYAVVIEQLPDGRDPVVLCRDEAGRPVRRPLPGTYPRVPVSDASEPCPACGAIDWERFVPTESWRGGRPGPGGAVIPDPIVVCHRCGHEEQEAAPMRLPSPGAGEASAAPTEEARAEQKALQNDRDRMTLSALTFPVYAADGWPARIAGTAWSGGDLTDLTIAQSVATAADHADARGELEVTTSSEAPFGGNLVRAGATLEQWVQSQIALEHPPPAHLSDAAMTLWLREIDRRRRAATLSADRSETLIEIDGAFEPFLRLSTASGKSVAIRRHYDVTVTIAARNFDPATVRLEPILDPAAGLLGATR
jgi:hypothetical protein